MSSGFGSIQFLQELSEEDRQWILSSGVEFQANSGTRLIRQGEEGSRILILLHGLLVVHLDEMPHVDLSYIGPGELIGEVAFLESGQSSANVTARENSLVLAIKFEDLNRKLRSDEGFGSRFHESMARLLARRLRKNAERLPDTIPDQQEVSTPLISAMLEFKDLFLRAEELDRTSRGGITEEFSREFVTQVQQLELEVNEAIGSSSELSRTMRDHLGRKLKAEMLPYILISRIAERAYTKPRGYAGDYLTIEWIYQDEPSGVGSLGRLIDQAFLGLACSGAVCNRRGLLTDQLDRAVKSRGGDRVEVTSFACGPARELYDHFKSYKGDSPVHAHLIDIDAEALEFVEGWRNELDLAAQIDLQQLNLVYLCLGRHQLDLPPQDLVYSIGLIDYFDDEFVIRLLNFIHELLRPGGRVIVGNFHPSNRSRALMDHVFDWKLIHRDEGDMNRLFRASSFASDCSEILYEQQEINLFACCQR